LSQIVRDTSAIQFRTVRLGGSAYQTHFRLPFSTDDLMPDAFGKHIPVTAEDAGCGRTTVDVIQIDLDTVPPDETGLALDPQPEVTTEDSLTVTGRAPGSAVVQIYRDLSEKDTVEPDSVDGSFRSRIPLAIGENRIQIKGRDLAGNPTPIFPTSAIVVTRVNGATLAVQSPYSREDRSGVLADDIRLLDPDGMEDASIRIFNLEGDCIWEASSPGGRTAGFGVHWDGHDRAGRRAPQGYYLVRGEWRDAHGKSRALHHGLLLRD
jgi:hypothetical protein